MIDPLVRGFVAVPLACGTLLASLAIWHKSGNLISVWLGLVTAAMVATGAAVLYALLWAVPGGLAAARAISANLFVCLVFGAAIAVTALGVAMVVTDPGSASDFGLYVPIGIVYGLVSGVAFWLAARPWNV